MREKFLMENNMDMAYISGIMEMYTKDILIMSLSKKK
jgi:hypothetical protein